MLPDQSKHLIFQIYDSRIRSVFNSFIMDRESMGLSPKTIIYYTDSLNAFKKFLDKNDVDNILDISANTIRAYMIDMSSHLSNGGIHAHYRALHAFFAWLEQELEGEYTNPMKHIHPPKVSNDPLPGIPIEHVLKLINATNTSRSSVRDQAVFMCLVDTGCRASEFLALNIEDIDLLSGSVLVRHGKGNKARTVYLGRKSKQALRSYLKTRSDLYMDDPLWCTQKGTRLTIAGLREIIRRRAKNAGIKAPGIHDFRRCFAIQMLRNGCDLITLSRLMGHTSTEVLKRYLALTDHDLHSVHKASNPMDNIRQV